MYKIFLLIFCLGCEPVSVKSPRWFHDVNILILDSSNKKLEKYLRSCVKKIDKVFPYDITIINNSIHYDILIQFPMSDKDWKQTGHAKDGDGESNIHYEANTMEILKVQVAFRNKAISKDTVCHEMLHSFGVLEHSQNKKDVMYEYVRPARKRADYKSALDNLKQVYYLK